jgi:predicted  nucleic acid-binding Zn-ribbon protein
MKTVENIRWYCDSCVKKILKLINDVARVEERQDKTEEEIGNVKELIEKTRSEISQIRQETVNELGGVEQTKNDVSQLRQETERELESVKKIG